MDELIETTRSWLNGALVGVANIRERAYQQADGQTVFGVSAQLYIGDQDAIVVGPGSVFVVGDLTYTVVDVQPSDLHRGIITVSAEHSGK